MNSVRVKSARFRMRTSQSGVVSSSQSSCTPSTTSKEWSSSVCIVAGGVPANDVACAIEARPTQAHSKQLAATKLLAMFLRVKCSLRFKMFCSFATGFALFTEDIEDVAASDESRRMDGFSEFLDADAFRFDRFQPPPLYTVIFARGQPQIAVVREQGV